MTAQKANRSPGRRGHPGPSWRPSWLFERRSADSERPTFVCRLVNFPLPPPHVTLVAFARFDQFSWHEHPPGVLNANSFGACSVPVGKTSNLPTREKAAEMTVSELIDQLSAMPPDATVMLWSRMDDPQNRRLESVELSTTKSDPYAEVVVLS